MCVCVCVCVLGMEVCGEAKHSSKTDSPLGGVIREW